MQKEVIKRAVDAESPSKKLQYLEHQLGPPGSYPETQEKVKRIEIENQVLQGNDGRETAQDSTNYLEDAVNNRNQQNPAECPERTTAGQSSEPAVEELPRAEDDEYGKGKITNKKLGRRNAEIRTAAADEIETKEKK